MISSINYGFTFQVLFFLETAVVINHAFYDFHFAVSYSILIFFDLYSLSVINTALIKETVELSSCLGEHEELSVYIYSFQNFTNKNHTIRLRY